MTQRASYRFGVSWIADNDEPDSLNADEIEGYVTTMLLADLFGKETADVAKAILRYRQKRNREEER